MSRRIIRKNLTSSINNKWIENEIPNNEFTFLTDSDYKLVKFEDIESIWNENDNIFVNTKFHLITTKENLDIHLKSNRKKIIYGVNINEFKESILNDDICFNKNDFSKSKKTLYNKTKKIFINNSDILSKEKSNKNTLVAEKEISDITESNKNTPAAEKEISDTTESNKNTPVAEKEILDTTESNKNTPVAEKEISDTTESNKNTPVAEKEISDTTKSNGKSNKRTKNEKVDIVTSYNQISYNRMLDVTGYSKTGKYKSIPMLKTDKGTKKYSTGLRIASADLESYIKAANELDPNKYKNDIEFVTNIFNNPTINTNETKKSKKSQKKFTEPFNKVNIIEDTYECEPLRELFTTKNVSMPYENFDVDIKLTEEGYETNQEIGITNDENVEEEYEEEEEEEEDDE